MVSTTPATAARLPDGGRFVALDSLRGIAAIMVVAFHLQDGGLPVGSKLVANSWLVVDFFFVLSGFVISGAYRDKLASGFSIARFMVLRLGRVYPLHLAILSIYVVMEFAVMVLHAMGFDVRAGFSGDHSVSGLLLTALLLQGLVEPNPLVWAPPSWSISVEVWLYLAIGLGYRFFGIRSLPAVLGLAAAALAFIASNFQGWFTPQTADLVRGVAGFGLGCLAWWCWDNHVRHNASRMSATGWTFIELTIAALIVGALSVADAPRYLAALDLLFAAAVLIFAADRGAISRGLATAAFTWLGVLSYSVYLGHMLVLSAGMKFLVFTGLYAADGGSPISMIITLMSWAAMIAGTIMLAYVTWRFIEAPARDWSRNLAAKMGAAGEERAAPTI